MQLILLLLISLSSCIELELSARQEIYRTYRSYIKLADEKTVNASFSLAASSSTVSQHSPLYADASSIFYGRYYEGIASKALYATHVSEYPVPGSGVVYNQLKSDTFKSEPEIDKSAPKFYQTCEYVNEEGKPEKLKNCPTLIYKENRLCLMGFGSLKCMNVVGDNMKVINFEFVQLGLLSEKNLGVGAKVRISCNGSSISYIVVLTKTFDETPFFTCTNGISLNSKAISDSDVSDGKEEVVKFIEVTNPEEDIDSVSFLYVDEFVVDKPPDGDKFYRPILLKFSDTTKALFMKTKGNSLAFSYVSGARTVDIDYKISNIDDKYLFLFEINQRLHPSNNSDKQLFALLLCNKNGQDLNIEIRIIEAALDKNASLNQLSISDKDYGFNATRTIKNATIKTVGKRGFIFQSSNDLNYIDIDDLILSETPISDENTYSYSTFIPVSTMNGQIKNNAYIYPSTANFLDLLTTEYPSKTNSNAVGTMNITMVTCSNSLFGETNPNLSNETCAYKRVYISYGTQILEVLLSPYESVISPKAVDIANDNYIKNNRVIVGAYQKTVTTGSDIIEIALPLDSQDAQGGCSLDSMTNTDSVFLKTRPLFAYLTSNPTKKNEYDISIEHATSKIITEVQNYKRTIDASYKFIPKALISYPCVPQVVFVVAIVDAEKYSLQWDTLKDKNDCKIKVDLICSKIQKMINYIKTSMDKGMTELRCLFPFSADGKANETKFDQNEGFKNSFCFYSKPMTSDPKKPNEGHEPYRYRNYIYFYDTENQVTRQIKIIGKLLGIDGKPLNSYTNENAEATTPVPDTCEPVTVQVDPTTTKIVPFSLLALNQEYGYVLGKYKQNVLGGIETSYFIGSTPKITSTGITAPAGLKKCRRIDNSISPVLPSSMKYLLDGAVKYAIVPNPAANVTIALLAFVPKDHCWMVANISYCYTVVILHCKPTSLESCNDVTYFDIPNLNVGKQTDFKFSIDQSADVFLMSGPRMANIEELSINNIPNQDTYESQYISKFVMSPLTVYEMANYRKGINYASLSTIEKKQLFSVEKVGLTASQKIGASCWTRSTLKTSFSFKNGVTTPSIVMLNETPDGECYTDTPDYILLRAREKEFMLTGGNFALSTVTSNNNISATLIIQIPTDALIIDEGELDLYSDIHIQPVFEESIKIEGNKDYSRKEWRISPIITVAKREKFILQYTTQLNSDLNDEIGSLKQTNNEIKTANINEVEGYKNIIKYAMIACSVFAAAAIALAAVLGWLFSRLRKQDAVLLDLLKDIHEMSSGKTREQIEAEKLEKEAAEKEKRLYYGEIKPVAPKNATAAVAASDPKATQKTELTLPKLK